MVIFMKNIILIGMAGCGKSTVGVLLAKTLGCGFIDTDLLIQKKEKKLLQQIINEDGLAQFLAAEEAVLCEVDTESTVIATGGSAVYSKAGMAALKKNGVCVWLKLPFSEIERRIHNIATRGIAISPGKTLRDVFDEREPLYEAYADIIIEGAGDPEAAISEILAKL